MISCKDIVEILKSEVTPALGCTEPVAVALSGAAASYGLGEVLEVEVYISNNIFKNGMSVGLPGIKETGLNFAAALGAVGGDYKLGLEVLSTIKAEDVTKCHDLIDNNLVKVHTVSDCDKLYIEIKVKGTKGTGRSIIKGSHSNIVLIEKNDKVEFSKEYVATSNTSKAGLIKDELISDLINIIGTMEIKDLEFLFDGAEMNKKAADIGLEKRLGMGVGAGMYDCVKDGFLSENLSLMAQIYTAAASDARMSGYFIPVMSSAGSGNHGLTAILPVYIAGEWLKKDKEKIIRALAISHIITIYIKNYTGRLSALCGCSVAAATGASAGITYLLDGDCDKIEGAIKNMVANLSGVICDGAKPGCALKLSTAAACAVESALLSMKGVRVPYDNGIVDWSCEDTIKNLGKVSDPGMVTTDKVILDVMVDKKTNKHP